MTLVAVDLAGVIVGGVISLVVGLSVAVVGMTSGFFGRRHDRAEAIRLKRLALYESCLEWVQHTTDDLQLLSMDFESPYPNWQNGATSYRNDSQLALYATNTTRLLFRFWNLKTIHFFNERDRLRSLLRRFDDEERPGAEITARVTLGESLIVVRNAALAVENSMRREVLAKKQVKLEVESEGERRGAETVLHNEAVLHRLKSLPPEMLAEVFGMDSDNGSEPVADATEPPT